MVRKMNLIEPMVGKEELRLIGKVLDSGWLTEGPMAREFEVKLAEFVGAKYSVAMSSCTTALDLALRVLEVGYGDEVIVPDFTHPATGNIVRWIGAKPVLVDVDLLTYNIDAEEVEKAITKDTKCIMPVSWGGNPLNMQPLNKLKEKHNLFIIEDAACSLGAEYNEKKTGTMADITCFSFHPRKIITTGEGGMAVTDNPIYAEKLESFKRFGMTTKNGEIIFTQNGTNYKLSDILGAVGVAQMEKVARIIDRRIELANYYNKLLAEVDSIRAPEKRENTKHVYQTYAAYIEKEGARNKLIHDLRKKNIETQIGTYALHLQPGYERVKKIGKLERSEKLYKNLLTLPMCNSMTKKDQEYVVSEIENLLRQYC